MMRRVLFRLIALAPACATGGSLIWAASLSPFSAPLVEVTTAQAQQAIDRALARQVTPDWIAQEMDLALTANDWNRVQTLALIGADQGFAPSPDTQERIDAVEAAETGLLADAEECLVCMADVAACPSVAALAACGVPFELTPLGDVNALRRAGVAALNGDEVDTLDVTLALAGIGATAAVVVSGGTSYTAKVGTTALRVGRRLGTITGPFLRVLGDLADVGLKSDRILPYLAGRVPLDEVLDTARLARIEGVGSDLARVATNTSMAEAVTLLRYVDTAEDATRLARVSDVLGPRTGRVLDVLGKGRVFRAMVRLTDLALGTIALITAFATQLAIFMGERFGRVCVSLLRGAGRP